jgi:Flp pilus assembly protein TadG
MHLAGLGKYELASASSNAAGDAVIVAHMLCLAIRKTAALRRVCRDDRAAQIVEFAVSLPVLVVFVVGIFDFSGALSLKQKLTNAARDAARVGAADPANDLSGAGNNNLPVSVSDAYQVVDNYLLSENINDCGLKSQTPALNTGLTWSVSATTGCPGTGLTLTINRGCFTPLTIGTATVDVVNTCVTIQYPYKWRFNSVITLLVPGAKYGSVTYISANATAFNEN